MFVVSLQYKKGIDVVDRFLQEHVEFLKQQYFEGKFLFSGRKIPRTGGVIISGMKNRDDLMAVLAVDPFFINDVAEYEVTEFVASMTSPDLEFLREE